MTLAELIIKSYDQTLTREQRGEYYRQAVDMAQKEVSKPKRAKRTDVPEGFEEWYKHYPHKVARGYAEKAYAQARGIATQDQLIRGANWYSQNKPEETPWAHPASWLNAKRWLDGEADAKEGVKQWDCAWPEWKKEVARTIGTAQTATWFKDCEYSTDKDNMETYFDLPENAVNWVKDRYKEQLGKAFGPVQIRVKK